MNAKRDNYETVTNAMIAALERGVAPWTCPWDRTLGLPRNGASGHIYQGVNVWLTWATAWDKGYGDPRWFTFNQVQQGYKGAHVRKGEKGTMIVKWLFLEPKQRQDETDAEYAERKRRKIPLLKLYSVFNTEQIEWGENGPPKLTDAEPIDLEKVNADAAEFLATVGAEIKHGGARAFYDPEHDRIGLPPVEAFKTVADYLATAFHEVIHWTGHESRCARDLKGRFGSESYAAEELVAELGAAFLCTDYGVEGKLQHPDYIGHWLKVLRADKYAIFTAARLARDAANFTKVKPVAKSDSAERAVA